MIWYMYVSYILSKGAQDFVHSYYRSIYFILSMDQTMQMYDNFVGFPLL